MKKIPIIIDCDPGCDDAIALLLAYNSPILDIKGVTVSAGNVHINNTTENARKLTALFRKDIPVARGCEKPLFKTIVTAPEVHGESGIGSVVLPNSDKALESLNAVEFIAKTLRESTEKVTIVVTGPMTNIAVFLITYPELKEKIDKFVIMGGSAVGGNVTPCAEFNIYVDAEAADIVFKSEVEIVLCPLDVTLKAYLTEENLSDIKSVGNDASLIAHGAIRTAFDFHKSINEATSVPMHDPCTIAYLIDPTIFSGKKVFVGVELRGEFSYGETIIDYKNKLKRTPNALILNEVDRDRFNSLILESIKAYN